ncbi:MAG: SHOCT domain-containing protein, partial [Armatimonadota bacterium]
RFGMAKSDPLGTFVAVTGDMAKLMQEAQSEQEIASRPPKEAREIVLLLCDQQTLREHIDQGIEAKLQEIGVQEVGRTLLTHVETQSTRFPRAILRPYQQAVTDYLEQINYNPDAGILPSPKMGVTVVDSAPVAPAALPPVTESVVTAASSAPSNGSGALTIRERLANLKALLDDGLINEDDFNSRKASILSEV